LALHASAHGTPRETIILPKTAKQEPEKRFSAVHRPISPAGNEAPVAAKSGRKRNPVRFEAHSAAAHSFPCADHSRALPSLDETPEL
jgi:hypothetical protein